MANSLVSLVMQFLTPDVIAKIASALGLDRSIAQKAITGAIPAILAGLAGTASNPGGARQLSNAVSQQQPGMLDSLTSLIGGTGQKPFTDTGSGLLSKLLGGHTLDALTQSVGKFAGVGENTSKSLLGMLGPVVLGALGQQQRSTGLDAGGLASLLTSQKDQFAAAIPAGLADQLNISGVIDKLGGGFRTGAAEAAGAVERTAYAASSQAARAARGASSSQWPLWAIGLIALAGLAWYFLGSRGDEKVAELPRVTTQPATVGLGAPKLTVGDFDVGSQVSASVGTLRTTLAGISDAASAQAALPKIQDAMAKLDEVNRVSAKLPPEGKQALARMISGAMPAINELCDKVLAMPGAGGIARPAIDELRNKLNTLARA
jgi:hypothetical protein